MTVSYGKIFNTCAENSNGRIERPLHTSLLNSSQKASRYATRRQIKSADGSIPACKLQKLVMCISGTKFEEHCFNISRDIFYSVFYHFGCTVCYVITFQYRSVSTFRTKKDISKRKAPFACILKSLSNNQQLFFHFIGTLISSKGLSFVGHCSMFNQAPALLFESCN